ncbi:MAG: pyrroline-5-carboxylate reductase [Thermaerobacter sp.]|nr:pyrroline-5-carboxylate reductase [Thermaerobacter sp.]
MNRVVIVGSGNLAHALLTGWMRQPSPVRFQVLARSHRYLSRGWESPASDCVVTNPRILTNADLVVLAVKPKDIPDALLTVRTYSPAFTPVLSAAAGITLDRLAESLPRRPLIRAMPNICSRVGSSVTGVSFSGVSPSQRAIVRELLAVLGEVVETEEHLLNPMTALYGSGPAYVYVFVNTIVDTAQQLGLPRDVARTLALQMVRGSSELALAETDQPFDRLVEQVASPGGTTEAMLKVLDQADWPGVMKRALLQAGERARQLGATPVGSSPV